MFVAWLWRMIWNVPSRGNSQYHRHRIHISYSQKIPYISSNSTITGVLGKSLPPVSILFFSSEGSGFVGFFFADISLEALWGWMSLPVSLSRVLIYNLKDSLTCTSTSNATPYSIQGQGWTTEPVKSTILEASAVIGITGPPSRNLLICGYSMERWQNVTSSLFLYISNHVSVLSHMMRIK